MVPRGAGRGANSSGGASTGSSASAPENKCAKSGNFTSSNWLNCVWLAVLGLTLLLFLILSWQSWRARRRFKSKSEKIVRWYNWGVALVCMILYYILLIIAMSLYYCNVFNTKQASAMSVTYSIFENVGQVLVLAIILLNITPRLLKFSVNEPPKLLRIALAALTGTIAVISIAYLIALCIQISDEARGLGNIMNSLKATFSFLYWIAAVAASAILIFSLKRLKVAHARKGLTISVPLLVASLQIWSIGNVVTTFLFDVFPGNYPQWTSLIRMMIINFSNILVFWFAHSIATAPWAYDLAAYADMCKAYSADHEDQEDQLKQPIVSFPGLFELNSQQQSPYELNSEQQEAYELYSPQQEVPESPANTVRTERPQTTNTSAVKQNNPGKKHNPGRKAKWRLFKRARIS